MGLCGSKFAKDFADNASQVSPRSPISPYSERSDLDNVSPQPEEYWLLDGDDDVGVSTRPGLSWSAVAFEASSRRRRLISDTFANIKKFYDLDKEKLGSGGFGYVCKATCRETGAVRAVKKLSKARARDTRRRFREEIQIMKMMDHPNIIKLYETFEDRQHIFLVMELCKGGDLGKKLVEQEYFSEAQGAVLMEQILRPVFFLHVKKHICHRDLKPENFLFLKEATTEQNTLKIIDFGLSRKFASDEVMSTKLGTVNYTSPQVLAGQYDESCDLWSCGVIMYVLLSGLCPFQGKTDVETLQNVRRGNYAFQGPLWEQVSEDAKDLVRKLLKYNSPERLTAQEALAHPWFKTMLPKNRLSFTVRPMLILDLHRFCMQNRLRRAVLYLIAGQLQEDDVHEFRTEFYALDDFGAGVLTVEKLEEGLKSMEDCVDIPDLSEVLLELSAGAGGDISYTDFLAARLEAKHYLKDGACRAAFRVFDKNGDGHISVEELQEVLNGKVSLVAPDITQLMEQVDSNGDGAIDFQEFKNMMRDPGPLCT